MRRLLARDRSIGQRFGPVARCTVERLMRARGLAGVRRGKPPITTRRGKHVTERAPDLVKRHFHAAKPNQLWVVDLVRHEALSNRVGVRDLHRRAVAAVRS